MVAMHNVNWFLDLMLLPVLMKNLVGFCGAIYLDTGVELNICRGRTLRLVEDTCYNNATKDHVYGLILLTERQKTVGGAHGVVSLSVQDLVGVEYKEQRENVIIPGNHELFQIIHCE